MRVKSRKAGDPGLRSTADSMTKMMAGRWLASFLPSSATVSLTERLRASFGALVGIFLTGAISSWAVGATLALPLLIAPMGASAVLLFAVPASPLAQPWSIIGGNVVASLCGITAARFIGQPLIAAPIAIGTTIAFMITLRCTHPPSGAVALTAVLGGPTVMDMGYRFVLWPVLLNSIVIVCAAIAYNNATRRKYPHPQGAAAVAGHGTRDENPTRRFSFATADLDAVMKRYDQVLDVSRDDMETLFHQVEMAAYQRRFDIITCADIMSRDLVSVEWGTPLQEAWTTMRKRRLAAMPVIDRAQRVLGMLRDADFMKDPGLDGYNDLATKLRRLLRPPQTDYADRPEVVGQIMTTNVSTMSMDANIAALIPLLVEEGARHVPIVDLERRLVGIVAQSDLIAALYRNRLIEDATEVA